ncbi:cobyric acid synthase [Caldimonas tepidiphila]|uniref:cobyric acid synthase n=1 Tax=Caldimonas tepidiphila TaxID=2315841 RepID=UPI000E5C35A9|nr:cobyric acid synthase [Caldimonas tepidiphila]
MTARCVMVLGTTSGAGKSFLATALCRWYARQGLRVAPYKAQNMSNNARVVAGLSGAGEIGAAQYFQALAAGVAPDVRMNPVLLKPEADTRSQVVLMGEVDAALSALPWRERSARLWPAAEAALRALRAENEVVVIEGAGSPAEINLAASDYVNTRTAIVAEAACLLVTDIDRGGAFAHLYGTHALMDAQVRTQLRGFVLNKFRGDARLLAPAPQRLEELTGVPTVAVLPMRRGHGLPEEDGVFDGAPRGEGLRVAVLAYPHVSNLDEFEPLRNLPGVRLSWARDAAAVQAADWLILPGSKHTRADLAWLRERGLDAAVRAHAAAQRPLLAVCGGLQMLGEAVDDPLGVEGGAAGRTAGLGVLPLRTEFAARKTVRAARTRFESLHGPWAALSGCELSGYEIRHGHTAVAAAGACDTAEALPGGLGWQRGSVLALYVHGLFENAAVLRALFGRDAPTLDDVFERLADELDACFTPGTLMNLLEPR